MTDRPSSAPVLRFAGATMAFRLESALGDWSRVPAEELVGKEIEVTGDLGLLRGTVRTVEPYVDPSLGPGHWVTLG